MCAVISHCDRERMSNKFTIQWTSIDWILFILVSNLVREKFSFNISLFAYTTCKHQHIQCRFSFLQIATNRLHVCKCLYRYKRKKKKENDSKYDNFYWILDTKQVESEANENVSPRMTWVLLKDFLHRYYWRSSSDSYIGRHQVRR